MKRISLLLIFVIISFYLLFSFYKDTISINKFETNNIEHKVFKYNFNIDDPVDIVLNVYCSDPNKDYSYETICRIKTDFNNDNLTDVAVSLLSFRGAHGGYWEIFLKENEHKYKDIGDLWINEASLKNYTFKQRCINSSSL